MVCVSVGAFICWITLYMTSSGFKAIFFETLQSTGKMTPG